MILLTLFATSCYWRDTPIVEFSSVADFFQPRALAEIDTGPGLAWLKRFVGKGGEIYASDRLRIVL